MFDIDLDLDIERYTHPLLRAWAKHTFTPKLRARLYRKLAARLENGVRLRDTIASLHERAATHGKTETLAIILPDVLHTLDRGEGLAAALMPWVNSLECTAIASGEKSGKMVETLRHSADSLGDVREIVKTIRNNMAYPLLLFITIIATAYFIGAWFLPEMTALAPASQFTDVALSLYWFSAFVQSAWFWIILAALVGSIITIIKLLPVAFGDDRFRVYLDKVPPWSIYRLVVGSSFLVTLSALLQSGIALQEALILINKYASPYLSVRLNAILDEIRKGRNFGDALDATEYRFPDDEIIDDLIVYSTLPHFEQVLYEYGKNWMAEGLETIKEQAIILQTIAFLIMAAVIGWLVIGVMQMQQQLGAVMQQVN
jgi:type II secretory pathway component PulF